MIEFSKVRAGYGFREILHGIDFTVNRGEIVSLIGPNGCGKTTLLRAACGFLPLSGGEIRFLGRKQAEFGRREFARLAAFLPQARDVPAIRADSLIAHGRYPHLSFGRDLTDKDRKAIELAIEQTGVSGLLGKELSELSGGERQRVYLAMTLAQDAEILFLDEPTTYLDIGQKHETLELIRKIRDLGKTILMVLHDLPLAFACSDRIALLENGSLRAFGPAGEVFDSGLPAEIFGVSSRRVELEGKTEYLFFRE
ncbi:ABC transporter ATP-binding protein [Neglectibacter caecimuris]|uniref:ABC transporter ATP-binding protein n=1 Tax=Neglectibacter caecimuris TaxID=3093658 RepID=UPI002AC8A610|nr:ABC transporter ATP-binding protein [Neglectibacter sp. M00184]